MTTTSWCVIIHIVLSKLSIAIIIAGVAQWQSSWFVISRLLVRLRSPAPGGIPEWPKGADCKSVVSDFDGSNPSSPTRKKHLHSQVLFQFYSRLTRVLLLRSDIRLRRVLLPTAVVWANRIPLRHWRNIPFAKAKISCRTKWGISRKAPSLTKYDIPKTGCIITVRNSQKKALALASAFSVLFACSECYCDAEIFGFAELYCLRRLCARIEYRCAMVAIGEISLLRRQKYHAERSEAYHLKI